MRSAIAVRIAIAACGVIPLTGAVMLLPIRPVPPSAVATTAVQPQAASPLCGLIPSPTFCNSSL